MYSIVNLSLEAYEKILKDMLIWELEQLPLRSVLIVIG